MQLHLTSELHVTITNQSFFLTKFPLSYFPVLSCYVKHAERKDDVMRVKSWGIYVRYGRICLTKRTGSLLKTLQRYNRLIKRKANSNIRVSLIPIYYDDKAT